MLEWMPLVWLAVVVLIVLIEAMTMGLVSVWFLPGALIALILSLCKVDLLWQILAFVVLAVVMLVFGKTIFRPFGKKEKTNTDTLIGKTALITEQVDNIRGLGTAKVGAQVWSARAETEAEIFEVGEQVTIVQIQGVKLICRKKNS